MTNALLIRNVRPMGDAAADILIRDGQIETIAPDIVCDNATIEQGHGAIALPGLVEAHTHLDKNLLGMGWRPHQAGPGLMDKIENERHLKSEWDIDPARQSARQVVLSMSKGSTHIRSHVDIDTQVGLKGLAGVLETRQHYQHDVDIQIVAFPQSGLMSRPGTAALMADAMSMGADVVGGLDPCSIDRDPKGQLDTVFALAEKHQKPIDIHLHEPDELGALSMEMIIERTRAHSMQGRVVVSHAFCLGMSNRTRAWALTEQLADANISIATVATASRPVPDATELRRAGVALCAGSDGIRDTWGPYGNPDMLERAMLLGLRNNFRTDHDLEYALWACTHGGAVAMNISDYGLAQHCAGDVVLVDAESVAHAVVDRPVRKLVVKRGRVIARDGACLVTAT